MAFVDGKYFNIKIHGKTDEKLSKQLMHLTKAHCLNGEVVRMMPDARFSGESPLGITVTTQAKSVLSPGLFGRDLGCGLDTAVLSVEDIDFKKLDRLIRDNVPFGTKLRSEVHEYSNKIDFYSLKCLKVDDEKARMSMGTLGGRGHFIELGRGDTTGKVYLTVHSGSRGLGVIVKDHYTSLAVKETIKTYNKYQENLIEYLKKSGRQSEIECEVKQIKELKEFNSSPEFAFLMDDTLVDFINDLKIAQNYAKWNRLAIIQTIVDGMGWKSFEGLISTPHNYFDEREGIVRSEASPANANLPFIIPINMRDGCLLCTGLGNPDWNNSAPRGAGRVLGRADIKSKHSLAEYKKETSHVYSTTVNMGTIGESPMAYMSINEVIKDIGETAKVHDIIRPIYNFKAH